MRKKNCLYETEHQATKESNPWVKIKKMRGVWGIT
jgi:hypothetical protein